jgi:hypothetical protein
LAALAFAKTSARRRLKSRTRVDHGSTAGMTGRN